MMNKDEGDPLQRNFMLSTPFNALLAPLVCMAQGLGLGHMGHLCVPKCSKIIFSKIALRPLRVLKQVILGYFAP